MLTVENALPEGMRAEELAPVLTEWVASIAAMTRPGRGSSVVLPSTISVNGLLIR